jgi:hypothetical protein
MARNFPSFLDAYFEYAQDNFCPNRFHRWVGFSVLAAALERKVSLKNGRVHIVPNIYVLLVSHPAVGKTTAMDAGVELLEILKKDYNTNFRIISNQITEPAFIKAMNIVDRYPLPNNPNVILPQSAGFFYASEASASALQNTCGDFVATMTAFYDCPRWFRKETKIDGAATEIENACMNLLAGSTFNYLKTLINDQSVLGGFSSRLIYVVEEDRKVRKTKWDENRDLDDRTKRALVEDLVHINKLIGPMKPTAGWKAAFEKWKPEFDQYLIDLKSERMEAIMARKSTALQKIAILLSISEGDSMILTEEHFERALVIVEDVYKDNHKIIVSAVTSDVTTQKGTTQYIMQMIKRKGGSMTRMELNSLIMGNGNDLMMAASTIDGLIGGGWVTISDGLIHARVEPNSHL